MRKSIIGAVCACLAVVSFSANSAPVEVDWLTPGDGLITYDANTGLEWLDLTATANRSYNDVSSQFGEGGEFEGFRYATRSELAGLWISFGGSGVWNGWSTSNNGVFDAMAPFVGDLLADYAISRGLDWTSGDGGNFWITLYNPSQEFKLARAYDSVSDPLSVNYDYFHYGITSWTKDKTSVEAGSALIRDITVVPIPAAIWLFGSGLIGLIGLARRKANA